MYLLVRSVVFLMLLSGPASAVADDAHDKLVCGPYSRKVQPSGGNAQETGLTSEQRQSGSAHFVFAVGDPPRRLTVAELNEEVEPFGSKENKQRLVKLIKETIVPKPPKPGGTNTAGVLPWSKPVNGLAARIEHVGNEDYTGFTVLVRLKNVSDKPLSVPTGNPVHSRKARLFELYERREGGSWVRRPWGERLGVRTGNRRHRPPAALQPGESGLAYLCGTKFRDDNEDDTVVKATRIKLVLRQPVTDENDRWHGVLETLPHRARAPQRTKLFAGRLPFPEHFPALSHVRYSSYWSSMSGSEPDVQLLRISNRELINVLHLYQPAGVCAEFERRMLGEEDPAMKLLLAALAANNGSEAAGLFLMESMKDTDCETVENVHEALKIVLTSHASDPPDWIVELVQAALSDDRDVTGLQNPQVWELAHNPGYLARALGHVRCRKAVPFLIEMVKRTNGDWQPVEALGNIGDRRAVPVLLEHIGVPAEWGGIPPVIEALEKIGDPRALPAMRELVAAKGRLVRNGSPPNPNHDQKRFFGARLAVAALDQADAVPRLCEMLSDESLDDGQKRTVIWRLGDRRDARAVPHLIREIKNDPSMLVVVNSIRVLADVKSKEAVQGLIECFDVDFSAKDEFVGKRTTYTPAVYRDHIARSLRSITGQPYGADKDQWLKWWREKGANSMEQK